MKIPSEELLLYAVTDDRWNGNRSLLDLIEDALEGGCTLVQLREKNMSEWSLLMEASKALALCHRFGVKLIINDNVDIAKKSGADGIHLGKTDMPVAEAREILGKTYIIGKSVKTVEEALQAQADGADYLGVGACFGSATKGDATQIDLDVINEITRAVEIPVVGIGGINKSNMKELEGRGLSGAAVVSAIFSSRDIVKDTIELKALAQKTFGN